MVLTSTVERMMMKITTLVLVITNNIKIVNMVILDMVILLMIIVMK